MRYEETQIGKLLEQIKLAVLSSTPVVYIPTQQVEIINELLFSPQTSNSIIPRMCFKDDKLIGLPPNAFSENGKMIVDNYKIVSQSSDIKDVEQYPTLYIWYMKDAKRESKEWDATITASIVKFIRQYFDIK